MAIVRLQLAPSADVSGVEQAAGIDGGSSRLIGGSIVGGLVGCSFGRDPTLPGLNFVGLTLRAPAQFVAHELSNSLCYEEAAFLAFDRHPHASGEDVLEMQGALVARGMNDFSGQIVAARKCFSKGGILIGEGEEVGDPRSVASEQTLRDLDG